MTLLSDSDVVRKTIGASLRFRVLRRCGFVCTYCGARSFEKPLHIDHVVPLAAGGLHVEANLTAACADCNLGKGICSVNLVTHKARLNNAKADHLRIVAAAYQADRKRCAASYVIRKLLTKLDADWLLQLVEEAVSVGRLGNDAINYMCQYAYPVYRGEA